MAHHTQSGKLRVIGLFLIFGSFSIGYAQSTVLTCTATAVPTLVRTEGLAERMGDILLLCSGGTAGTPVSGNLNLILPVSITNRIDADSLATDISLSIDTVVPGPPVRGRVSGRSISFIGINFTVPASGAVTFRISNLRANVNQLGVFTQVPVQAFIASNLSSTTLTNNPVTVARPARGLFATLSSTGISCTGSPLPSTISMSSLFAAGTRFASTRISEGFANAFEVKDAASDSGTRIVVRYTGIPAGAHLFVPDVIAGSDAVTPTAGGDLGGTQSGGEYAPSAAGSLLLSRVNLTDANGAGGQVFYTPGAPGSGTVALDSASEVVSQDGKGMVVYEVVDANALLPQSAQFPTFVGIADVNANAVIQETLSLGPISNEPAASSGAPVPRFTEVEPGSDCPSRGDCDAGFFPRLAVSAEPLLFSAIAGGAAMQPPGYIAVNNKGGGVMSWTASVTYKKGSGWLTLDVTSGVNDHTVRVFPAPQKLAPGTYEATVTVDASPVAGLVNLPVVLAVQTMPAIPVAPQPPPMQGPPVSVSGIANSANFVFAAIAPGSQATVMGSNLAGSSVMVSFDGIAAKLLETSDTRIGLLVPVELGSKTSALMTVTVNGVTSAPSLVALAPVAPAIFLGGIRNQDGSANGPDSPAAPGSVLRVLTTGLAAAAGGVTVKIHDRDELSPLSFGPVEGAEGIQQVEVAVPEGLPAMTTDMLVCAFGPDGQRVCSHPAQVTIGPV